LGDIIFVNGYKLDNEQEEIVLSDKKYMLVIAGAGSGKSLTIMGKINYLIDKGVNPHEILLVSFTSETCHDLKNKIQYDIDIYTFHKLGLKILSDNDKKYTIANDEVLKNIIHHFFYVDVLNNNKLKNIIIKLLKKNKNYENILNSKELYILMLKIEKFIHLFKSRGFSLYDFVRINKRIKLNIFNYFNNHYFLTIVLNIYMIYQKYLQDNNEIDFDDIIIQATDVIKNNGILKKYKYIMVDEYQDTSYIRFQLIRKIVLKTNSSLLAVGDDFQSIYRFTGCDINIFINFNKYFPDAIIKKITTSYRTSDELIKVAGNFVMQNRKQLKKSLKSNKHLNSCVKVILFKDYSTILEKIINEIYEKYFTSILILGRYNKDIKKYICDKIFKLEGDKVTYLKNNNIRIRYLTVHKSKGLEDDNVILINVIDDVMGFPSKLKSDNIFKYVFPKIDKYKYSEERRLFYVALTRSKNNVYILSKIGNESVFIKELIKYKNVKIMKYD
jgi:DNA helicase-4